MNTPYTSIYNVILTLKMSLDTVNRLSARLMDCRKILQLNMKEKQIALR